MFSETVTRRKVPSRWPPSPGHAQERRRAVAKTRSPESTAPDVPTALTCLSGASTTPTAPDEHGAQTSRAQRGALAPGTIMGRTGYETTRPRARAFENYHGPSSSARHSARRPWEGGRRMDGRSRRRRARADHLYMIVAGKGLNLVLASYTCNPRVKSVCCTDNGRV